MSVWLFLLLKSSGCSYTLDHVFFGGVFLSLVVANESEVGLAVIRDQRLFVCWRSRGLSRGAVLFHSMFT